MSSKEKRGCAEIIADCKTLIFDVEGTTTSISFVKDTLFPYVRTNLQTYITSNWNSDELKADLALLRKQADQDVADKVEDCVPIPSDGTDDELQAAVIANVLWQMDKDRKTKALKQLQGHIMQDGYTQGVLKGHVYPDVAPALRTWADNGLKLYIYSSGSVDAQKLLFGNSIEGNLLEFLQGHFDTEVGSKQDADSYKRISKLVDCSPSEIVFFTDVPAEAKAAQAAGMTPVLVVREGNAPLSEEDRELYEIVFSFNGFLATSPRKRLKISSSEEVPSCDVEMPNVSEAPIPSIPNIPNKIVETDDMKETVEVKQNLKKEGAVEDDMMEVENEVAMDKADVIMDANEDAVLHTESKIQENVKGIALTTDKEIAADTDKEVKVDTDKEIKVDTDQEIDKEIAADTDKEIKVDTDKEIDKEIVADTAKEVEVDTDKEIDKEITADTGKEIKVDTDKEIDKEITADTDKEVKVDTDKEIDKEIAADTGKEIKVDTDKEIDKEVTADTGKEIKVDTDKEIDKEITADTGKEIAVGTDKEIAVGTDMEIPLDTDKKDTVDIDKETVMETDEEITVGIHKEVNVTTDKEITTDLAKEVVDVAIDNVDTEQATIKAEKDFTDNERNKTVLTIDVYRPRAGDTTTASSDVHSLNVETKPHSDTEDNNMEIKAEVLHPCITNKESETNLENDTNAVEQLEAKAFNKDIAPMGEAPIPEVLPANNILDENEVIVPQTVRKTDVPEAVVEQLVPKENQDTAEAMDSDENKTVSCNGQSTDIVETDKASGEQTNTPTEESTLAGEKGQDSTEKVDNAECVEENDNQRTGFGIKSEGVKVCSGPPENGVNSESEAMEIVGADHADENKSIELSYGNEPDKTKTNLDHEAPEKINGSECEPEEMEVEVHEKDAGTNGTQDTDLVYTKTDTCSGGATNGVEIGQGDVGTLTELPKNVESGKDAIPVDEVKVKKLVTDNAADDAENAIPVAMET